MGRKIYGLPPGGGACGKITNKLKHLFNAASGRKELHKQVHF